MKVYVFLIVSVFLAGCGSKKPVDVYKSPPEERPVELQKFPDDVLNNSETVDIQLALQDRGLYLNTLREIKLLDRTKCTLEIAAHRGDPNQLENSVPSISHALVNGFDTVEIDIMQLKDGLWIVHHDPITGRVTDAQNRKVFKITSLTSNDWQYIKFRDTKTGMLKDESPPFLPEAMEAFVGLAKSSQKINVELKSTLSSDEALKIDLYMQEVAGSNYYYSSLNLESLKTVRSINQHVYLGLIQKPHNKSVRILKKSGQKGAAGNATYQKYRSEVNALANYAERYYRWINKDWTSGKSLTYMKSLLGSNSGLHIDVRRLVETPNVIRRAHLRGLKLHTYTVNGTKYHQEQLLRVKRSKGLLPDGVIIDTSVYRVCQQLYGISKAKHEYSAKTKLGKMIVALPNNADLERYLDQEGYFSEGMYITMDGAIEFLNSHKKTTRRGLKKIKHSSTPRVIKDVKMNLNIIDTITIKVPGR